MADNVPITAGVGTSIATDEVAGAHYQIVKLGYGALDAITLVSTTNGLPVVAGSAASPTLISPGLKTTEQLTRVVISVSASGDTNLVAADAANKFRIYALVFTVATPVAVKLGEGGPTYWTGAMTFGAGGGLFLPQQGEPHFLTSAVNKALLINLSAAVQCSGVLWYTAAP